MKTQADRARECRDACVGLRNPESNVQELIAIVDELHVFADDLDHGAEEVAEFVMGTLRPRMRAVLRDVDKEARAECSGG